MSPTARKDTHNSTLEPVVNNVRAITQDEAKIEFGRRLQRLMVERNLNQSDLARKAKAFLPTGAKFGRDSISVYIAGKSLPRPTQLEAICKALNCEPADLLPARGIPSAADRNTPFAMRDVGDGNVELKIHQVIPWAVALELIKNLKGKLKT